MNIVGLGKAGCNIAELFKKHPQYTVFKIDTDEKYKRKKNCFHIPKQSSVELYDANRLDLSKLKQKLDEDEELYFILCGSGKVAACSLWILEQLADRKINIVYIKPDSTNLDQKSRLANRAHFHILQEYVRSGVFEKIYIVDNNRMSDVVGKSSVLQYYSKINNFIVDTVHWLNIYRNTDPVFDTYRDMYISSRICTFSYVDIEEGESKQIYFLKKCNQVKYFYGVNRIVIESDEDLLEKLNRVSSSEEEDISVSYGIYSTELEQGFSFAVLSSSDIQQEE